LFRYPALRLTRERRFESISWKTIYNIASKNKGAFVLANEEEG